MKGISICSSFHIQAKNSGTPPSYPGGRRKHATAAGGGQSAVKALPIRIISVGKKMSPGVQLLVHDYTAKLNDYCPLHHLLIRSNPNNATDATVQVHDEDTSVIKAIRPDDWVVLLDEHGKDMDSLQLAELVGAAGNTGASRLLFCIGGPYGHGPQLRKRANVMDHSQRTKVPPLVSYSNQAIQVLQQFKGSLYPRTKYTDDWQGNHDSYFR